MYNELMNAFRLARLTFAALLALSAASIGGAQKPPLTPQIPAPKWERYRFPDFPFSVEIPAPIRVVEGDEGLKTYTGVGGGKVYRFNFGNLAATFQIFKREQNLRFSAEDAVRTGEAFTKLVFADAVDDARTRREARREAGEVRFFQVIMGVREPGTGDLLAYGFYAAADGDQLCFCRFVFKEPDLPNAARFLGSRQYLDAATGWPRSYIGLPGVIVALPAQLGEGAAISSPFSDLFSTATQWQATAGDLRFRFIELTPIEATKPDEALATTVVTKVVASIKESPNVADLIVADEKTKVAGEPALKASLKYIQDGAPKEALLLCFSLWGKAWLMQGFYPSGDAVSKEKVLKVLASVRTIGGSVIGSPKPSQEFAPKRRIP